MLFPTWQVMTRWNYIFAARVFFWETRFFSMFCFWVLNCKRLLKKKKMWWKCQSVWSRNLLERHQCWSEIPLLPLSGRMLSGLSGACQSAWVSSCQTVRLSSWQAARLFGCQACHACQAVNLPGLSACQAGRILSVLIGNPFLRQHAVSSVMCNQ